MTDLDQLRPWRVRSSRYALDVPWYRVRHDEVELPDGRVIDYYRSERPDGAMVLPITADGEVLLVRQYKHGAQAVMLELPGGLVNPGEDPAAAAYRELLEETGFATDAPLQSLGWVMADASKSCERLFSFIARDVAQVADPRLEHTERASGLLLERRPLAELPALIESGELVSQATVVTVLKGLARLTLSAGQDPHVAPDQARTGQRG